MRCGSFLRFARYYKTTASAEKRGGGIMIIISMPSRFIARLLIFLLVPGVVYSAPVRLTAAASPPQLVLRSAENCRSCHEPVFREWKQSWMARAYVNDAFQIDFQQWRAYAPTIGQNPNSCLACHAPAGLLMGEEKIGLEGVTCEVCHRVAKVSKNDMRYHLVMDAGNTEYGRDGSGETPFHQIRPGEPLGDSTLCGGCHLDVLENGIALERTYQEWSKSLYAQNNIQCGNCHMPKTAGSATASASGDYDKNVTHASHLFDGGHSGSPLLKGTATLSLKLGTGADRLQARVTNTAVGHHFPTGGAHPSELILELTFMKANGKPINSDRRVYKMWYLNSKGQPALANEDTESVRDTTLKPQETRVEEFTLPKSYDSIKAELVYHPVAIDAHKKYGKQTLDAYYKPVLIAKCTASLIKSTLKNTCVD